MRLIWKNPDGSISITVPNNPNEDMQALAKKEGVKPYPDSVLVEICPKERIPQDRTFRNAWKHDLSVDMSKARELWKERMRKARTPKLAVLDNDYMKAHERQDEKKLKEVAELKQKLRDVTSHPAIEAADTPEKLKEVWPDELK